MKAWQLTIVKIRLRNRKHDMTKRKKLITRTIIAVLVLVSIVGGKLVMDKQTHNQRVAKMAKKLRDEKFETAIAKKIKEKFPDIKKIKFDGTAKNDALAATMYHSTQSDLPADLKGALIGKASDAAQHFLKDIQKLKLITPVKGG